MLSFGLYKSADAQVSFEDSIKEVIVNYQQARERRDTVLLKQLFVGDADQLVSSGTWRTGSIELMDGMLRSSGRNPGNRTITVEKVRLLSASSAIADARYVISGTHGRPDRKMWSTFILVQVDDGWRIAAIRNMLPAG
jgi:uncharacterized protein (TIGR02246 family)